MATLLSTTAVADLLAPFGRGRGSLHNSFWYTGWLLTFLATGDQTQGRFALIEALTRKGNCPPRHIHRNEDESFYILEGEITALIGDQTIRGTPGTLIFGPRGVPHSFEIHSEQVRMLLLLTAAGLEGYFKQFCTPAAALTLPPPAEIPYVDIQNPDCLFVKVRNCECSAQALKRRASFARIALPGRPGAPSSTV
jgi:quercetin dioxygenase-like cupin family protein